MPAKFPDSGRNSSIRTPDSPVDIRFIIPLPPRTKKNHQRIRVNRKTGVRYIVQSDAYVQYAEACMLFIPHSARVSLDRPVNIQALYFMEKDAKVDISNLHSALHDILVGAGVLKDDSSLHPKIVAGTDGSRVYIDAKNPRTEIVITSFDGEEGNSDGP